MDAKSLSPCETWPLVLPKKIKKITLMLSTSNLPNRTFDDACGHETRKEIVPASSQPNLPRSPARSTKGVPALRHGIHDSLV